MTRKNTVADLESVHEVSSDTWPRPKVSRRKQRPLRVAVGVRGCRARKHRRPKRVGHIVPFVGHLHVFICRIAARRVRTAVRAGTGLPWLSGMSPRGGSWKALGYPSLAGRLKLVLNASLECHF